VANISSAHLSKSAAIGKPGTALAVHATTDHRALVQSAPNGHCVSLESAVRRRFATLDKFVAGSGNQLALAAAKMAADRPGSLTPLMFFGAPGCGKTHLLEGIWSVARAKHRGANIVYLSAEQFTTYFVEALRGSGLPSFRRKYRCVDLLMIDDLQFLVRARATRVELLHTIDALLREGRQLVFSADRSPAELSELGPELTTRLAGGMVCRLESPDLQMRCGLVQQFAQRLGIELSDDIAQLIATQVSSGARELSGAVNRLHAASRMLNRPISFELAQEALAELMRHSAKAVRLGDIEKAVCGLFGLPDESLQSNQRTKNVSMPRMLAMWLARKHTRAGLSEIGQYFGRRSHSTVISAHKRVTDWMDRRCQVDEAIRRVEEQLRAG
jgi:chromosomal replication initiator protein